MEIKQIKVTLFLLLTLPLLANAQVDCSDFFKYRKANPPFNYNSLSKSAVCVTGNKYEFIVPLTKGFDYRLQFFASPVFNNQIDFKIIDLNTNEVVMALPGESMDMAKGTCVLKAYFDEKTSKQVHPYFDFYPPNSTTLKIIIDVKPIQVVQNTAAGAYNAPAPREKGCITVLILDRPSSETGFSN